MRRRMIRPLALAILLTGLLVSGLAAMEPEHQETRDLIAFVDRAVALFEEQGQAACATFKTPEWRPGDVYAFVIGLDGHAYCHPARPSLEGTNILDLRDPDGKPIVRQFVTQVGGESGAGWVHYLWPRPGRGILHWKSSYVRRAHHGDADFIVGAGAYQLKVEKTFVVERVEAAAELLRQQGTAAYDTLRDKAGGFLFLDTYVFVMSTDGVMRVNPRFPDMEGNMVLDIEDDAGHYPGREILAAIADQDAAWVGYQWPRPNETRSSRKETYVRKVQVGDLTLAVASGVYTDP